MLAKTFSITKLNTQIWNEVNFEVISPILCLTLNQKLNIHTHTHEEVVEDQCKMEEMILDSKGSVGNITMCLFFSLLSREKMAFFTRPRFNIPPLPADDV